MESPTILEHLAAFIIGVALPVQSLLQGSVFEEIEEPLSSQEKWRIYSLNSLSQWIMTLLLLLIWWFSDRTWDQLGLKWPAFPLDSSLWVLFSGLLFLYFLDAYLGMRNQIAREKKRADAKKFTPFLPTSANEFFRFLLVVFTAAICEEIIFRGFLINYLASFFHQNALGMACTIGIPAIIFSISHSYQGPEAVAKIAVLAIVFGTLFLLSGSLLLPIVLHFLVNLFSALLGWYLHA